MKAMESLLNEDPHVTAYNHVSKHIEWCVFDHAEVTMLDRLNVIYTTARLVCAIVRRTRYRVSKT